MFMAGAAAAARAMESSASADGGGGGGDDVDDGALPPGGGGGGGGALSSHRVVFVDAIVCRKENCDGDIPVDVFDEVVVGLDPLVPMIYLL